MKQTLKLQVNDNIPLRESVALTLRQAILEGLLQPGDRLMELHLAQQLGVSRTPVREAIRMLEKEELVRIMPRRGAVVSGVTKREMEEMEEVCRELEDLAVRRAGRCMTPEKMDALRAAASEFEEAAGRGDLMVAAQADAAFSEIISQVAGNRQLLDVLEYLRPRLFRFRLEMLKNKTSQSERAGRHRLIIETLQ